MSGSQGPVPPLNRTPSASRASTTQQRLCVKQREEVPPSTLNTVTPPLSGLERLSLQCSLSVSPDRAQHFTYDVITLSCGFNSTGADSTVWRRFSDNTLSSQQCHWSKDKSKCEFYLPEKTSAVFWCESGSGEMSNALNISVHRDIILMSPVRAVTEGQSVSLSCKLKKGIFTSVQFYKNGKMIQNGTEPELNITAVSRSDEGFYKCEGQWKLWPRSKPNTVISPESWMSIKSAPKGELSSLLFPVMWVVGPVCAVVLLMILLLLCHFLKRKDLCTLRTQRTNQSSAEDHVTSNDHTSPSNAIYSLLELKYVRGRNNPPQDESCVYSNIRPHSSGENVTHAQVNHHKKKQNKENTLDDNIYSHINHQ
ncbi:uncharacterized protein LOC129409767 isoform X2 [Boleophthalmus pectinirostris]|uniref:uncharacterized protein LOC129409767 isoform X2 n=1 Tax=Boleophthalmus pectinirostris TaxID=150288 RepID=UPI00242B262F|nr:uncharacterized protein LOC129409767 isoform X2 [Boleophthalmus pectinirostris]